MAAIDEPAPTWQDVILPLADACPTAPALDVRADDPWSEAGRKVLGYHFGRVLVRVPGVVAGEDPEEVHAMRVAARRMRAAWRVFGDAYDRRTTRAYLDELRTLGGRLGVVRDLDVRIGILVAYGEHHSKRDRVGLRPLLAAWEADRAARHAELVEILTTGWFTEVAEGLAAFVETPGVVGAAGGAADTATSSATGRRRSSGTTTRRSPRSPATWTGRRSRPSMNCVSRRSGFAIRSSSCVSRWAPVPASSCVGSSSCRTTSATSTTCTRPPSPPTPTPTGAVALTAPTTAAIGRFVGYQEAAYERLRGVSSPPGRASQMPATVVGSDGPWRASDASSRSDDDERARLRHHGARWRQR